MLEGAAHEVERARSDLTRVRAGAAAWADAGRQRFDKQRLNPLDGAAKQLLAAIRQCQEQVTRAQALLASSN